MGADQALFLLNHLLWVAALISAPILGATLIIGLIVSILQVATQIQEVTLSYVPKLLAAAALIILLGPWMLSNLTQFAISIYQSIPSLSR
jgi:flagellar biosynthesis protein FliQ